ncbi:MAG: ParA family protein [Nitrosospira sp.]|nr:ParA family protein [Nitrosospira sp.]
MSNNNLLELAEIADLAGASKQAVSNWCMRYDHFPRPIQNPQSGSVWEREKIGAWVKSFNGEETHVLSFININGGGGITTTAVAVAEMLAQDERKHVLLIDLDPQTNATASLISEDQWAEMDKDGRTIAQLFEDRLNPHNAPKFDIEKATAHQVSTIKGGIARLDLLPSSIRLIDLEYRISMIALSGNFTANPLEILQVAIQPVIDRYDYIIIDCPPSLGTMTKNGLRISTGYVIPATPNLVATLGIYLIVDNVERFAQDIGLPIPPLGIVATKVQANNMHRQVIADLTTKRLGRFSEPGGLPQPSLFRNKIPKTVAVARSANVDADFRTLKEKYGVAYDALHGLTLEIKQLCEKKRH